ncbi:MAG: chitobiase/beta-hexosaminidase C-terminal domain-containing protein [Lachnospiraceae bacterium]|nr:chitobiase/beta-hexosaminidase C-terminal domain-containing protein [Lachnospiraceae bacterium]
MTCPECGAVIADGEVICPLCHKEIELVSEYHSVETLIRNKNVLGRQKKEKTSERYREIISQSRENTLKRKQNKLLVMISVFCVILVILLVFGVKYYTDIRNKNDFNYQYSHARTAFENGDVEGAWAFLNQALHLDSASVSARELYAAMLLKEGQSGEAEKLYKTLIKEDPTLIDDYQALLDIYEDQGRGEDMKALLMGSSDKIREFFHDYIPDAPVFDPAESDFDSPTKMTIKDMPDCTIYFTTDGTDPTRASDVYTGFPISLEEGRNEIRAMAVNSYDIDGDITIAVYNISLAQPDPAVITPESGYYPTGSTISVEVPEGCKAYYAFDETPDDACLPVVGEIVMPEGTHIFSVIVKNEYGKYSSVVSETYVVN